MLKLLQFEPEHCSLIKKEYKKQQVTHVAT